LIGVCFSKERNIGEGDVRRFYAREGKAEEGGPTWKTKKLGQKLEKGKTFKTGINLCQGGSLLEEDVKAVLGELGGGTLVLEEGGDSVYIVGHSPPKGGRGETGEKPLGGTFAFLEGPWLRGEGGGRVLGKALKTKNLF